jgi:hypothetical protein
MTSIADRFDQALTDQGGPPEVELLPMGLARAAVAVLPVAGAGLSAMAHPDLRLPIGSSDDVAAFAERLQFTRGVGPCLLAYRAGRPQLFTEAELQGAWPELHDQLRSVTPFRSIASLPLQESPSRIRVGALDLYLPDPAGLGSDAMADAVLVADRIGAILMATGLYTAVAQRATAPPRRPPHTDHLARRALVWKAMGLLNVQLRVTAPDALSLLRARAYATDQLVDDVAHDVLTQRMPVEDLRP